MNTSLIKTMMALCCLTWLGTSMIPAAHASSAGMDATPPQLEDLVRPTNWYKKPHVSWSTRNAGAMLGALMVPRSGAIKELPLGLMKPEVVEGFSFTNFEGHQQPLLDALKKADTDGLLMIKDGKVIYERYFNGLSHNDHHMWFSATKSLTALAVGVLVDEGKLSVDAQVTQYLPELKKSGYEGVTVQQVLDMSTGLNFHEVRATKYFQKPQGEPPLEARYAFAMGFVPNPKLLFGDVKKVGYPGVHGLAGKILRDSKLKPGERFEYQSINTDVLGWLVSRVSGQPLQRFISDRFWSKLGAEHDGFFTVDSAKVALAAGGFNSTLRDAAKLGLMVLSGGQFDGKQLVSAKWIDKLSSGISQQDRHRMSITEYADKADLSYTPFFEAYKNQWWIIDSAQGAYTAMGLKGQLIYINKTSNLVLALFSSRDLKDQNNVLSPAFKNQIMGLHRFAESLN